MRDINTLNPRHFLLTTSFWMGIFILTDTTIAAHPFEDIVNDPSMEYEKKGSQIRLLASDEIFKSEFLKERYQNLSKELPNLPPHFVELLEAISEVYGAQKAVWTFRQQLAEMRICAQSEKENRPIKIRRGQIVQKETKLRPFTLGYSDAETADFHDDVREIIKQVSKHYHDNDSEHFMDTAKIFLPLLREEKELARFYRQDEEKASPNAHSPQPTSALH